MMGCSDYCLLSSSYIIYTTTNLSSFSNYNQVVTGPRRLSRSRKQVCNTYFHETILRMLQIFRRWRIFMLCLQITKLWKSSIVDIITINIFTISERMFYRFC
jgi:hypothetical protein